MLARHVWIVPLLPAAIAVFILFFARRFSSRGATPGIAAMFTNFIMSAVVLGEWVSGPRRPVVSQHIWFTTGTDHVTAGTLVDGLSALLLVLVSFISLLVQIYSANYMKNDRRFTHFFAILTLFSAAMEWFVVSANTLQMVFGWEVMSLCSFLLIGHWWEEKSNVHAALKAFLTTRASDIGLFVGVVTLYFAAGRTFDIVQLNQGALTGSIHHDLLLAGAIALFVAVIGKSAQFPLHTWLPDAMAGPTPMSALIHAATMVVAGVYLVARLFPVFAQGFSIAPLAHHAAVANPIAIIGAITIVIAALLAFVQQDIKKLLSYSTVSQLGYMVMALGVGAWTAAIFHLVTHALSKALLFLAAGSVSHGVHGFDIERDMGGLRRPMPVTHATFLVGALALVGVVPLSGFWSKEQITDQAGAHGYGIFAGIALLGTVLTAAYMTRCYYRVFLGEHRGSSHPHESPVSLTGPCVVLAICTALAGFLQAPALHLNVLSDWITPDYLKRFANPPLGAGAFLVEVPATALGIGLAWLALSKGLGPGALARRFSTARVVSNMLHNRYYIDWLYDKVFVHGIRKVLAWTVHWIDHNIIDNSIDSIGFSMVRLGRLVDRRIDHDLVDGFIHDVSATTEGASGLLRRLQSGKVQRSAAMMLGAVAVAAVILVLRK